MPLANPPGSDAAALGEAGADRHSRRTSLRALFLLLACTLPLLAARAFAASHGPEFQGEYVQHNWQSSDGLPQNTIEAVLQTHEGYLWIATEKGLVRFDGSHFRTFNYANTPALRDSYIASLYESQDGTLWIGSGLNSLTAYKDGGFRAVDTPISGTEGKISAIQQDGKGDLWLGTDRRGAFRFHNGVAGSFAKANGLPGEEILAMLADRQGTVWVSTDAGGLDRWNGIRFQPASSGDGLSSRRVQALSEDAPGSLWVGAGNRIIHLATTTEGNRLLGTESTGGFVRSLHVDRREDLWVGTDENGLEVHRRDGAIVHFKMANGFPSDTVQTLFEDREGSLWAGTDRGGLVQLRRATFLSLSSKDGLRLNGVRAIAPGASSSVWIGTTAGLNRWRNGVLSDYLIKGAPGSRDFRSILEDHRGDLWIGTDGSGLLRLRKGTGSTTAFGSELKDAVITALAEDAEGRIWAGTPDGLAVLDHGAMRTLTTHDGLPSDVILTLYVDRSHRLWVGTAHGMACIDVNDAVRRFDVRNGFTSDAVLSIHEEPSGELWIGTYEGLFHWDGSHFAHLSTREGLGSDAVLDLVEDQNGDLWLRDTTGASRVTRGELSAFLAGRLAALHPLRWGLQDGLLGSETGGGQPSSLRLDDGTLWFASTRGLSIVNPSHLPLSRLPPPVKITDVLVDGRAVDNTTVPRLGPTRGSLEFHFAAITFIDPVSVRYRYQLEGFDKGWIDAGARTDAYYTNIPPGSYRFRVIACNRDEQWNDTGAFFDLNLPAHFHQTVPFYFLCAIAAGTSLFIAHRARLRFMQASLFARQQELELLVAQRTAQLEEEKEQLLAARETLRTQARRDGLTGVLNRVAILEQLEEELERSARSGRPFTLTMLDIDHFKTVNDTYGHLVGDAVLRQVSARLRRHLRNYDGMGRYGGEEFLILIPDFDAHVDPARLERLRESVSAEPVEEGSIQIHVTCSFGVTTLRNGELWAAETLLAAADLALYQAKRDGRNRVVYADPHHEPISFRHKVKRDQPPSLAHETAEQAEVSSTGRA